MSHEATVLIAPVLTAERLNDPKENLPGRVFYERSGLTFLPNREDIPLVVNHDMSREIGRVRSLWCCDWLDGPWIAADCTVTARPSWLGRGTRASFAHWGDVDASWGYKWVRSAWVKEVSVLAPGVEPAEPMASVLSFRPARSPAAGRGSSDRNPAAGGTDDGEVIYGGGRIVRTFSTPIIVRGQCGEIIRNEPDGTQTIWANAREYRADTGSRAQF